MIPKNTCLLGDSYKLTHHPVYPPGTEYLHAYLESRGMGQGAPRGSDEVCFFGLQALLLENLIGEVVTEEMVEEADVFCRAHFGQDLFNRDGWLHIVHEHGGKLPVSIRAVPEGTVVGNRNVLMVIENTCPKVPWLVNFLETYLVQVWYPTAVATLSRSIKQQLVLSMKRTAGHTGGVEFKLHDFGFRGVSSVESAGLGGMAHLVSFAGSDTIQGIRYAQEYYGAEMPGFSIPATEHSVMTARGEEGEGAVLDQVLDRFPTGLVATVGDSYDICHYIEILLAERRERILAREGVLVIRPDSGDPVLMVIQVLEALEKVFGTTLNSQGYKVLPDQVRVIQGDGVDATSIRQILAQMAIRKWSTENIAFGMGGALLQHLNRDTFRFAFKLSNITIKGIEHPICKNPKGAPEKASKPGRLKLVRDAEGTYRTVSPSEEGKDELVEVFRNGALLCRQGFGGIQARAAINNG